MLLFVITANQISFACIMVFLITTEAQASDLIVQLQVSIDKTKSDPRLNTQTTGYEHLNIILEDTAKRSQENNEVDIEDTCHWLSKEFDNRNTLKTDVIDKVLLTLLVQLCEEKLPEENSSTLKTRLVGFCESVRAAQDQDREGSEVPENMQTTMEKTQREIKIGKWLKQQWRCGVLPRERSPNRSPSERRHLDRSGGSSARNQCQVAMVV